MVTIIAAILGILFCAASGVLIGAVLILRYIADKYPNAYAAIMKGTPTNAPCCKQCPFLDVDKLVNELENHLKRASR